MKIEIRRNETSRAIIYRKAINTYTKGPMYCVLTFDNKVHKYPLCSIFRVEEEYEGSKSDEKYPYYTFLKL